MAFKCPKTPKYGAFGLFLLPFRDGVVKFGFAVYNLHLGCYNKDDVRKNAPVFAVYSLMMQV
jgi:hypothetical protein